MSRVHLSSRFGRVLPLALVAVAGFAVTVSIRDIPQLSCVFDKADDRLLPFDISRLAKTYDTSTTATAGPAPSV